MNTHFHDQILAYNGTQLRSHFCYENFHLRGDCMVAFIGSCDVQINHLVDLEDVKNNKHIYSTAMLHFIAEHFSENLSLIIAYQRLLICLLHEELSENLPNTVLSRRGDDLYDGIYKLSVSIATKSPVSCLIHVGINISSSGTPLPTKGLQDYNLNPAVFAENILKRYQQEIASMQWARQKVRGVL